MAGITANFEVRRISDPGEVYVDTVSPDNSAHKGDWMVWSGSAAIPGQNTAYMRASGIGIALDNNPKWTNDGSGYHQTALKVAIAGTFRVTGAGNATAGQLVYQLLSGSGILGQTGATGRAGVWTALTRLAPTYSASAIIFPVWSGTNASWSASASAYFTVPASAVGIITRVITRAASGQWDISVFPPEVLRGLVGGYPDEN